jgi:O-antigen/teichoic acid export membrane protein
MLIFLQMFTMAALARLVTAADYGLLAGSLVIMRLLQHLLTAGPERAVMLLPDLGLPVLAAVFQALCGIGLAVGIVLVSCAGMAAWAGWSPAFFLTLIALAPLVPLATAGVVFRAVLRRHLAFGRLSFADIAAQLAGGGAIALVTAWMGWGIYALVAGQLTTSLLQTLLAGWFAHRAGYIRLTGAPARRWTVLTPVARSSLTISGTSFLEVVGGQFPITIIGTLLGSTPLGFYNRAVALVQMPLELLVTSVTRVRIATVSAQREDRYALVPACRELVAVVAAIVLPLCGGIAAAAPSLTETVLGPDWHAAIPVVAGVAILTAITMLGHVFGVINEGMLRFQARLRIQLLYMVCNALGLAGGGWLAGIEGALAGAAAAGVPFFLLQMRLAASCLGESFLSLLPPLVPGAMAAAGCALAVELAAPLLAGQVALVQLIANIGLCAMMTEGSYALFFPQLNGQLLRYAGLRRLAGDAGQPNNSNPP